MRVRRRETCEAMATPMIPLTSPQPFILSPV